MNNPPFSQNHRYFRGWYLKQQNSKQSLSLIPSVHMVAPNRIYGNLQVITGSSSYAVTLPIKDSMESNHQFSMKLGNCSFHEKGCRLEVDTPQLQLHGVLEYGNLLPPVYDIMGPFSYFPFMECRHHVISYSHPVNGNLMLNGELYSFQDGLGYIEGDSGVSFPKRYLWTQCSFPNGCIMLSIADIPFCGMEFVGCIGAIVYNGKEQRIATYLGAKPVYISSKKVRIQQGSLLLDVELVQENPLPLSAPKNGAMSLTIHESLQATVRYRGFSHGRQLFDVTRRRASFESHWKN